MIETATEVTGLFGQAFWHSLTVSYVGWIGLGVAMVQPVRTAGRLQQIAVDLASMAGLFFVFLHDFAAIYSQSNPDSGFLNDMAYVYGAPAAYACTWMIGRPIGLVMERWLARRCDDPGLGR